MTDLERSFGYEDGLESASDTAVISSEQMGVKISATTLLGSLSGSEDMFDKVTKNKTGSLLSSPKGSDTGLGNDIMSDGSLEYVKGVVLPLIEQYCLNPQHNITSVDDDHWAACSEFCANEQSDTTAEWILQEMNRHKSKLEPYVKRKVKEVVTQQTAEMEKRLSQWLSQTDIDLGKMTSPEDLYAAYCKDNESDMSLLEKKKDAYMKRFADAYKEMEAKKIETLGKSIDAWIQRTEIDLKKITSAEDLFAAYCKDHKADVPFLERKKAVFMQRFSEGYKEAEAEEKRKVDALEKSIDAWLQKTEIDLGAIASAEDLYAAYCKEHAADVPLLGKKKDAFMKRFADAYKEAENQEKKQFDEQERRIKKWILEMQIDVIKVKSADDLKKLYLQKYPKDKERCDTYKDHVTPLFLTAYKKAVEAHETLKRNTKIEIATATAILLKPEDVENESLKAAPLFVATMLIRLQRILMQHKKTDTLYRELETYAKTLIVKQHVVWKAKHEALTKQTTKDELRQVERAVASWQPPATLRLKSPHEYKTAFLRGSPSKEVIKRHDTFATALLNPQWEQYTLSQDLREAESLLEASKKDASVFTKLSQPMRDKIMKLSPAIAVALQEAEEGESDNALDEKILQKFNNVDWNAHIPALASFLNETQLRAGSAHFLRLTGSQKMGALLSGREEALAPFFLAMCGAMNSGEEIQRCIRELQLSKNVKDTMCIVLASETCRDAAYQVQRIPTVWAGLVRSLPSIGVSLKDIHLHTEDEERSDEEIDASMVQEVTEEAEQLEDEKNDADADSTKKDLGRSVRNRKIHEVLRGRLQTTEKEEETEEESVVDEMEEEAEMSEEEETEEESVVDEMEEEAEMSEEEETEEESVLRTNSNTIKIDVQEVLAA